MADVPIIRNNRNNIPAVRGTRLTVYNIMDHSLAGRTAAWIAEFYRITPEDAQAALDYIAEHNLELMPKYQRDLEWARRGNSPEVEALFAESHRKLMRLKEELDQKQVRGNQDARAAG